MSTLRYIKAFISDRQVASITPTSPFGLRKLLRLLDLTQRVDIVEFGPATGVITRKLLGAMTADSRLIVFETNPDFVEELRRIEDPRLAVHNLPAQAMRGVLEERGITSIDTVVSGIPFSFLKPHERSSLLRDCRDLLRPGGKFIAYQVYGHLKKPLASAFNNVRIHVELLNLPPLVITESVREAEPEPA
ncbi:MAG: methyltransferase domain-containing protein [Puniceicoccaceae bacterium]|nr:MAG: methyltransferase domain-containing protein [Puniceicoccaceae bacterium]